MITYYSPEELEKIRQGGEILASILQETLQKVAPGVTTRALDQFADNLIKDAGGEASFKMEPGYRWATCMNVNDIVVHGIPTDYPLQPGDRLGVDVGLYLNGFHTDASWSVLVSGGKGELLSNKLHFLEVGQEALNKAILAARLGNHIGDISHAMQQVVEGAGYSCVKQLVGHGVGHHLHEDPEVPCFLRGAIEKTPLIKPGMVLAIEVIYNQGASPVVYQNNDGWTIVTRDGSLSGLFEHTVAITASGPEILTRLTS